MTGITDDQLRPAFQTLATALGSVTDATALMGTAMDIAADKGISVEQAATILGKAVNGNGGRDVIDGGVGSTFISGGTGHAQSTFFLDGRAAGAAWSAPMAHGAGTVAAAGVASIAMFAPPGPVSGLLHKGVAFTLASPPDQPDRKSVV